MKKQIAWIFTGAALLGVAMIGSLEACSGDDNKTDAGGKDAAKDQTTQDVVGQDVVNNDSAPPQDGGSPECGSTPSLHPDDAGTIYCGFGDGGGLDCLTGQQCCLGGKVGNTFQPEDCVTWGGTCDNPAPDSGTSNPIPIECEQTSDCTANGKTANVCCLQGATAPAQVAGCGYYKSTQGTAISCETATCSGAGDIQICSSNADCPVTKPTCTPMKWKILQLGFCM